jgi:hypothetical protein
MQRRGILLASLATALLAAVCAHVGIDVLGDYLVRDDAYDHVAHGSRLIVGLIAFAIGTGVLARMFSVLCAHAGSQHMRNRMLAATRASALHIGGAVLGATLFFVPAMELFDALRAGSDLDDIGDLFGGSLALGLSVSVACAIVAAVLLVATMRWVCKHQDRIVSAISSLRARESAKVIVYRYERFTDTVIFTGISVARRRPERGPPACVTAPTT